MNIYGEYSPSWGTDYCYHIADVRFLQDRAAKLKELQVDNAAAMASLGAEVIRRCPLERDPNSPQACPFLNELGELALFAGKDSSRLPLIEQEIAFGKARRPVQLPPQQEILAGIIDEAYIDMSLKLGMATGRRPQFSGSCAPGAYLLQQELRAKGIESQTMCYYRQLFVHYFLRITFGDGEPLFVDPTWQQFIPKQTRRDLLPHTLIVPSSQVTDITTNFGVLSEWFNVWEAALPCNTQRREFNDTDLERIATLDGWLDKALPMPPAILDKFAINDQSKEASP